MTSSEGKDNLAECVRDIKACEYFLFKAKSNRKRLITLRRSIERDDSEKLNLLLNEYSQELFKCIKGVEEHISDALGHLQSPEARKYIESREKENQSLMKVFVEGKHEPKRYDLKFKPAIEKVSEKKNK